ncbi:MAG: sigma-54-dependent Fis family transcriptional regulator [Oscillochloris sp.]|nr:sigma-54-dependent Fis family transcriptional regulator [Oscillochloris sp.]
MSSLDQSTILIVDDEEPIRELLRDILEPEGACIRMASSGHEALEALAAAEPDVLICDVRMPPPDGLAVLKALRARGSSIPVLIVTAQASSTVTIEAMQGGAFDYISKPFIPATITETVQRALDQRRLTRSAATLQHPELDERDLLIGTSQAMQRIYKLIGRVAHGDTTVLITGESGTGKELVAHVLHRNSARHDGPFVVVNCAALPETLLETELFGHEKGAFTGALAQRKGRFDQAARGTIFLDEIGEMSAGTQKKLLRVLQERTFERVGGNLPVKADVRIIAATNRDLREEARNGSFREDLYYRLNVVNIHMPPLRERKDDIPMLVNHFLQKQRTRNAQPARITTAAIQRLMQAEWPGNVRQLANSIERAIVMAQGELIGPEHLQFDEVLASAETPLDGALAPLIGTGQSLSAILGDLRVRLIGLALQRSGGDRMAAATLLGVELGQLEG